MGGGCGWVNSMLTRSMAVRLASGVMNKREASPRFEDPIHFEDPIATKFPYILQISLKMSCVGIGC